MNRFPWKIFTAPRGAHSPRDGGTDSVSRQLSVLVTEYRNESERWDRDNADELWVSAWTLDSVRVQLQHGTMTADDAAQWVIAGWEILGKYQETRSRINHPAGRRR